MSSVTRRYAIRVQDTKHIIQASNPNLPLEILLALDRMVVEVSMHLYNVGSRDRSSMRRHNRRLHAAVKEHFPLLPKIGSNRKLQRS
jgi:hypothetical protein